MGLLSGAFSVYGFGERSIFHIPPFLPFQFELIGRAFLAVMILPLHAVLPLLVLLARCRTRCQFKGFAFRGAPSTCADCLSPQYSPACRCICRRRSHPLAARRSVEEAFAQTGALGVEAWALRGCPSRCGAACSILRAYPR